MNPSDYSLPRKLSTDDPCQNMNQPTNLSNLTQNNPSQLTQNEQSNFQTVDRLSFDTTSSYAMTIKDQDRFGRNQKQDRSSKKLELDIGYTREFGMTKSEVLSPINFVSSTGQNIEDQENLQPEPDRSHKVFEKYLEEYQKKFPSDVQHLKTSKQISSPDSKKSYAFRRICNNNSLGETLFSEFIQDPLHDKESHSKSSKSSNENLVNLSPPENAESPNQDPKSKFQGMDAAKKEAAEIKEMDSSIEGISDDNILKHSDLQALLRKKQRQLKKPVRFNVMVVGESGLGKSTFVDCFLESAYNVVNVIRNSTMQIQSKEGERTYNGITLKITMIDTPGYSPSIKIEDWYKSIKQNITDRFVAYKEEKKQRQKDKFLASKPLEDKRVHMVLYFLGGPRIRGRDMEIMKNLGKYCNVIPILAKGDSYTIEEIKELKTQLIAKAYNHKLEWFDFAEALKESPKKLNELNNSRLGPCPPFLIISSVNKIEISPNEYVYGRKYEYGICNIENPNHSDFKLLQTLLGGHICLEAIHLVDKRFYKKYNQKIKERQEREKSDEQTKTIAIGSALVLGVLGVAVAFRKKLGF